MSQNYPRVFLYHLDGGHIFRSDYVPTRKLEGKPSPFTILPLDENDEVVKLSSLIKSITTRAEYIHTLMSWKKVAIQDEQGKFLKCGKYIPISQSAQAWYSEEIGESEKFDLEHCAMTGTFSFKSYNELYIHYNPQLGTVAFKTRESKEASWHVHPLNLVASDSEQLLFLGVVNKKNQFLIERTAEGVANEWKVDLDLVLQNLFNGLKVQPGGSCTMFQHIVTQHQWCVTRSGEDTLNIVVSSERYPKTFSSECVEELEEIYKQFNDKEKDDRLKSSNIDKEDHFNKLLAGLMFDYDDQYSCSSFAAANDEIKKTMERMANNITKMQENIASTEDLLETTEELCEFASHFKKQSSILRTTMWRKTAILSGVLIGGTSGAIAGFLLGGPGAAAFLGLEAAEVAAGAGLGIFLGSSTAAACTSRFWKRKFVSFGKKMTLS
jgi:hypothetical protein